MTKDINVVEFFQKEFKPEFEVTDEDFEKSLDGLKTLKSLSKKYCGMFGVTFKNKPDYLVRAGGCHSNLLSTPNGISRTIFSLTHHPHLISDEWVNWFVNESYFKVSLAPQMTPEILKEFGVVCSTAYPSKYIQLANTHSRLTFENPRLIPSFNKYKELGFTGNYSYLLACFIGLNFDTSFQGHTYLNRFKTSKQVALFLEGKSEQEQWFKDLTSFQNNKRYAGVGSIFNSYLYEPDYFSSIHEQITNKLIPNQSSLSAEKLDPFGRKKPDSFHLKFSKMVEIMGGKFDPKQYADALAEILIEEYNLDKGLFYA